MHLYHSSASEFVILTVPYTSLPSSFLERAVCMIITVGRPNFTPCPYRTLAFSVYRTVPYRFPLKTVKPRTEPFETEFYTHILL